MRDVSDLRASDADREKVAERLSRHAAEGRLDHDELEDRVAAAYAAKTEGELALLLRDLPQERPRVRLPAVPRVNLTPEVRAYVGTMVLLVAIWALTGAGYFWPVWPALGWGASFVMGRGSCRTRRSSRRRLTA